MIKTWMSMVRAMVAIWSTWRPPPARSTLRRGVVGGLLAAAAVFGGVACGVGQPVGVSSPTVDTSTRSATAQPPSGVLACSIDRLAIVAGQQSSGSGHRGLVLVFTNTGSTTCRLYGYPGVAALDTQGNQTAQATRSPSGYLGGVAAGRAIPDVDLAAGQSASAMVEALAFNASDGSACTAYAGLLVTPPDETHSVQVAWSSDACSDLQIHPVVPGTTGQLP